ncbi:MAG: rod shape-determining protein MreD [Bacteroidetes bacterium GWA2_30_7]|nr:MAG: rod shape-determining protein MreD [Bacteroidetes bacterium GWA2_30_7]
MISLFFQYVGRFILFVLVQLLILNNIQFSGLINPYLYIMFIIILPFETPNWLILFTAFALGISIDSFTNTLGMHTSATLLIAFIRPYVLKIMAPREGYDTGTLPRIKFYGLQWFIRYSLIITVVHHFFLFYLEVFRLSDFFLTFSRAFISSIFTMILILLTHYLLFKNK